jgi:predicted AlkP superfamily phosphohydrolase/phosphomutase
MINRRTFLRRGALSAAGLALYGGCTTSRATGPTRKVIVLGFDGMDPAITDRLAREGKLPNVVALLQRGDFRPLGTTVPPLSPVAWASFTTGMNPGGHGIYDFVHRDATTLSPYLSTARAEAPGRTVRMGDWLIPLSSGKITLLREGKPFWEMLEERGVPTTIVRAPANFPPGPSGGKQLSGMGTPDLQGTYGVYAYFTDDEGFTPTGESGGEVFRVRRQNHQVRARLLGPANSFRADGRQTGADFTVSIDPRHAVAKIAIQGEDVLLRQGEWSPWVRVSFEMLPYVQSVSGIVRFYLKEAHPHFKLYATPVNIDPANPALPIATPEEYAHEMYEVLGPFYTQGMPHDTKALSNGVLDDHEFLQQAALVFDEHSRMFDFELERFRRGFLFLYTDHVDQVGHMFWRAIDGASPTSTRGAYAEVIEQTYRDVDGMIGKALARVDADTTLLVMSDHGFAPFHRAFNLNTWLRQMGYLALDGSRRAGSTPLEEYNWDATRAYGLGLQGLYLNLRGREQFGVVRRGGDGERLVAEIAARLLEVRDPRTGQKVVERVYRTAEVFKGPALAQAPDLVVGYARGYRVAWDSVLGKASEAVLADNTDKWSGDHSMAAELVPGVLLANRKISARQPSLVDLAPTVLAELATPTAVGMEGRSIF